jgi:hypothetical protein
MPFHATATDVFQHDDLFFPHCCQGLSLKKCGYEHFAAIQLGGAGVTEECLPIIHLVFANLKSWLLGTHHGVSINTFRPT